MKYLILIFSFLFFSTLSAQKINFVSMNSKPVNFTTTINVEKDVTIDELKILLANELGISKEIIFFYNLSNESEKIFECKPGNDVVTLRYSNIKISFTDLKKDISDAAEKNKCQTAKNFLLAANNFLDEENLSVYFTLNKEAKLEELLKMLLFVEQAGTEEWQRLLTLDQSIVTIKSKLMTIIKYTITNTTHEDVINLYQIWKKKNPYKVLELLSQVSAE